MSRSIYIAGAGIAGLTLALALAKFGASVTVLERHDAVQEYGAGLQISPNARRILNRLGLDRAITARSFEPEGIDVYPFGAAEPLTTMRLGPVMRQTFGAPYAVMHRADLAEVLFKACRRFANIDIAFGVSGFTVESHARGVNIAIEEGAGKWREARGTGFVGADGINSLTRTAILGGPVSRPAGAIAWRALIDAGDVVGTIALDRTSLLFGPGFHAVCYPLPHRRKVNLALFAPDRPQRSAGDEPRRAPELGRALKGSRRLEALMGLAEGKWGYWPLGTVTTDTWHKGHVGLVGDAAHAMLPFQAQGAAMAIEDAAILAPLLMTEPTAEAAFARYASLRQARVARVARLSAANAAAFHMPWPLSMARDAGVKLQGETGHLKRLAWIYGYDAAPEVEIPAPNRPS